MGQLAGWEALITTLSRAAVDASIVCGIFTCVFHGMQFQKTSKKASGQQQRLETGKAAGMNAESNRRWWVGVWRRETRRSIQRARLLSASPLPARQHPVTCTFSPSSSGSSTAGRTPSDDLTSNTIFASFLPFPYIPIHILFPTDGHSACSPADGLPPVVAFLRLISLVLPYHTRLRASIPPATEIGPYRCQHV